MTCAEAYRRTTDGWLNEAQPGAHGCGQRHPLNMACAEAKERHANLAILAARAERAADAWAPLLREAIARDAAHRRLDGALRLLERNPKD